MRAAGKRIHSLAEPSISIHILCPFSQLPFQSLHQMNVPHRHCVPTSFCPVGPIGLGHIQNCLPQFMPGFLVVNEMQGSPCSHRGTGFLEKSFVQPSFDASWEARGSESKDSEVMGDSGRGMSMVEWLGASLFVDGEAGGAASLRGSASAGLVRLWKKPLSDCWPLGALDVVVVLDFPRLTGLLGDADAEARRFSTDLSGLWVNAR